MPSVRDEIGYNQGWKGSWSTTVRKRRRAELIASRLRPRREGRLLEIGCGRGEMAQLLAEATGMSVLAVDASPAFVDEARDRHAHPRVTYRVVKFTDAASLDDGPFEGIVGDGVLHHLYPHLDDSLGALGQLLVNGGRLAFLEPNLHNPYIYLIFTRPALRSRARLDPQEMAFSRSYIADRLKHAAFADVAVEYRDFLIPGVPRWAVAPLVGLGRGAEKTPGLRHLAQSLLISAGTGT